MTQIPSDSRRLIDAIAATLDHQGPASGLLDHVADLPSLLEAASQIRPTVGPMVMLVDLAGRLVSQNAAAATRLSLPLGGMITDLALTPEAGNRFRSERQANTGVVTLAIATPADGTVLLLGHLVEGGGSLLMTEVERSIAPDLRASLAKAFGLIPSEAQVLDGLLRGEAAKKIAADLGRKPGTVRQQIKAIMTKMGVHSQTQLVSTAYALSLSHGVNLAQSPGSTIAPRPHQGAELFTGAHGVVGLHCFGPPDGIPVLFMHGALFGIAAFGPMRAAAETLGLRIIAPERPGYGYTPCAHGTDPVTQACAQALDLLDRRGIGRVGVLAHDIGTRFAARLAHDAPDRVAAVIAAPATPPMQTWAQTSDMPTRHRVNAWAAQHLPAMMDKIVMIGLRQIARRGIEVIPQLVFEGCDHDQAFLARAEAGEALQEGFHLAWAQHGEGFRADMRLTNENWVAEAARIKVPFLCLHGARSQTVSRRAVAQLAETLPQGQFQLVEDAGHSMPLSHPAVALRAALVAGHRAGLGSTVPGF